jgi:hypothetical protein
MTKDTHLIKPYYVGKDKRSLAIVIPSKVVKDCDIDPTKNLFLLKVDTKKHSIDIRILDADEL